MSPQWSDWLRAGCWLADKTDNILTTNLTECFPSLETGGLWSASQPHSLNVKFGGKKRLGGKRQKYLKESSLQGQYFTEKGREFSDGLAVEINY